MVSVNPLRVRNIVVHNVSPIYFLYSISTGDQDRSLLSKVVNFNRKNTYVRTLCLLGIIVCITSKQFHVRTLATNYTGSTSNEEHDFHENFLRSTSVRTMWRWYHWPSDQTGRQPQKPERHRYWQLPVFVSSSCQHYSDQWEILTVEEVILSLSTTATTSSSMTNFALVFQSPFIPNTFSAPVAWSINVAPILNLPALQTSFGFIKQWWLTHEIRFYPSYFSTPLFRVWIGVG